MRISERCGRKCNHVQEATQYYKEDLKDETENKDRSLSFRTDISRLFRYSPINILYETEKGRVVRCSSCQVNWYTQAEYSLYLSMQR